MEKFAKIKLLFEKKMIKMMIKEKEIEQKGVKNVKVRVNKREKFVDFSRFSKKLHGNSKDLVIIDKILRGRE